MSFYSGPFRPLIVHKYRMHPNFSDQSIRGFGDRMYSKTLQINRLFDYLFNKHEFLLR